MSSSKADRTPTSHVKPEDSLADDLPYYLEMANNGIKAPSAKELRIMTMMQRLRNGEL